MLETIIGALLPVVVTLVLGAVAAWRHDEDAEAAGALNAMVLRYALPLSLFVGTVSTSRTTLLSQLPLAAVLLAGMAVPFALCLCVARLVLHRPPGAAALQALGFGFPAIPFTGIPILTPLIGQETPVVVAIGGIVSNIVLVPATLVLLSMAQGGEHAESREAPAPSFGRVMSDALFQPVVVAPVLGLVIALTGSPMPSLLLKGFGLLAGTVGGMSLFASGIILQAQKPALSLAVAATTVARIVVTPALAFAALTAFGASPDLRREAVLALALPAASMQIILAVRNGTAEQENASFLLFSNVLSIPTLAAFIWLAG